jgi:hypothetical protein
MNLRDHLGRLHGGRRLRHPGHLHDGLRRLRRNARFRADLRLGRHPDYLVHLVHYVHPGRWGPLAHSRRCRRLHVRQVPREPELASVPLTYLPTFPMSHRASAAARSNPNSSNLHEIMPVCFRPPAPLALVLALTERPEEPCGADAARRATRACAPASSGASGLRPDARSGT